MSAILSQTAPARMAGPDWWRAPFRMMQTNLRLIDAGLDADSVADFVKAHGADAWLLNTGGIYASYPSDLASQTPNPNLDLRPSGDIVLDAVKAAHDRGLKLLARMDFSKVLPHMAAANPDWLYVSADGKHQIFNDLVTTCPSAGYFQEEVFTILDEVLTRYDVDGFFINWFMYSEMNYAHEYLGPCHCETCAKAWAKETGEHLPKGPQDANYQRWKAWATQNILDIGGRIRAHIAERKSGAPLILHDTADMRYVEANNAVGREFWPHQTAESVSAAFTRAPETPVLVNCVAFLDFPYRMAAEHPERFAQYLIQAMSRGGSISTYIMGPPHAIEYGAVGLAAEITRFHQANDDTYAELSTASKVLLVSPAEHMERGPIPAQVNEFRGLYTALQELHMPFDVIEAEHLQRLSTSQLERYELMVLPLGSGLAAGAVALIDSWVESGGALLATLSDVENADCLPRSIGVEAIVASDEDAQLLSAYAQDGQGAVIPLHGKAHHVVPSNTATAAAVLVPPARFGPPEYCYGHEPSAEPAILGNTWGKGRALTHTWSIGRAHKDLALADIRSALEESLNDLRGDLFIDTTLPEFVEITAAQCPGKRVYHLINHSGARSNGYGAYASVSGATLRIPGGAGGRARTLVSEADLSARVDGADLVVDLPVVDRFEVLVWSEQKSQERGAP
ncbi:alpha-amylase family protein [Arthrobacter sp. NPDC058130]|uniref:alpha-amylase family protein n=1 Tax=Arthrobacter sp. NPDC058130 TaxID=3346353 RepID=UPI0036E859BF